MTQTFIVCWSSYMIKYLLRVNNVYQLNGTKQQRSNIFIIDICISYRTYTCIKFYRIYCEPAKAYRSSQSHKILYRSTTCLQFVAYAHLMFIKGSPYIDARASLKIRHSFFYKIFYEIYFSEFELKMA